jgi:uncharacterized protein (DUF1501 family)
MLEFHPKQGPRQGDGVSRRDFLKAGSLGAGAVGLSLAELNHLSAGTATRDVNCILLFLVGAPSQLDTWDPKPGAPTTVRGPFKAIQTSVPGTLVSEHFPLMAKSAHRFAILRSVHHDAAPIHETGHQLMQTGHLFRGGQEYPHYGSVLSHIKGPRSAGQPPFVVLPAPIGNTGVSVGHGQGAAFLGPRHEPLMLRGEKGPGLASEKSALRDRYGRNTFGQSCLLARRLIEQGTRLVTVNMFDTVFNEVTWDCHADGGSLAVTLDDYKTTLCPMFDRAYTALLDDLHQRGLLDSTLVVAMGEFGRTPYLNSRGGRDHWPGVWSILFAGGGIQGGQVVGSSDRLGAEPKDRPVTPAQVAATVYQALGIDPGTRLIGPENRPLPIVDAEPIGELLVG